MKKAAVFVSGSGTNLEALLERQEAGDLNCEIVLVAADKDCMGLQRAKNHGIEAVYVNPKEFSGKEAYETRLLELLKAHDVSWIILAGYMRYIGKVLLEAYPWHIINLHPAYLPEFPGAHGILDAWNAGADQTGVTVHFVDAGIDTGEVILQERVPVDRSKTLEDLEAAVHAKEYDLFYRGINKALEREEA